MIMQLVRKDLLLAKKYLIVFIAFIVAAQILPMLFAADATAAQNGGFLVGLVFGQLMFFTTLSQLDGKYPKATALLCSAPYTRDTFVKAKYVLLLLLFIFTYIVNIIVTLIIGSMPFLTPTFLLLALTIDTIIFGIYIPLEIKYGYTKVRFIYMAVILVVAFLPQLISQFFYSIDFGAKPHESGILDKIFLAIDSAPTPVWCVIMVLVIVLVFFVSMKKSIIIFSNKEL